MKCISTQRILGIVIAFLLTTLTLVTISDTAEAFPPRCHGLGPIELAQAEQVATVSQHQNTLGSLEKSWSDSFPAQTRALDEETTSDPDCGAGGFRSFTRSNFRHNLGVQTRTTQPSNVQAHHVFPIKYESWFTSRGVNIHHPQYGTWWHSTPHQANKNAWNKSWQAFIADNPKASIGAIETHGSLLLFTYRLKRWWCQHVAMVDVRCRHWFESIRCSVLGQFRLAGPTRPTSA